MPPKLPTTLGPRDNPSTQRRVWSADNGQVARAQEAGARALGQVGNDISNYASDRHAIEVKESEKLKRDRLRHIRNEVKRESDEFLIGNQEKEGLYSKQSGSGVNVHSEYKDFWKKTRDTALKNAGGGDFQEALELELDDLNTMYNSKVLTHQSNQRKQYSAQVATANAESAINDIGYYHDDDEVTKRSVTVIEASVRAIGQDAGWDETTMENKLRDARSRAYTTQITSMTATDKPEAIEAAYEKFASLQDGDNLSLADRADMDKFFDTALPVARAQSEFKRIGSSGGPTEFEDISEFVMGDEIEGGDKLHIDNDGGLTKFGINKNHNPDVDVENLTEKQAYGIAKKRYWDTIDADNLSPEMRLVAFDGSYNHGPAKIKSMINKANGSPEKLISLRKAEYDRLNATGKEKYTSQHKGWMNRLGKLQEKISGGDVSSETVYRRAQALDEKTPGAGKELIDMFERKQNQKDKATKLRKAELTDNAREKLSESEGDYTVFTTQERAEYAQEGIDVTTLHKDFSDPAATTSLSLMTSDQLMNTDLDEKFGDRLSYKDLTIWKAEKVKLQDPNGKAIADNIDGVVNYFFRDAGLDPTKTGKDGNQEYVANMKNYIKNATSKQFVAGKEVTTKMINEVAADYLLNAKRGGGFDVPMPFSMGPSGFKIGGKSDKNALKTTYDDIPSKDVKRIRANLMEQKQIASDEQILQAYISEFGSE